MKQFGLGTRMALTISSAIVVTLTLMIALQVRQASRYARTEAFSKAEETAQRYANQVQARLNEAMQAARILAQTFEGMKTAWVDDRSLLNGTLSHVLKANTNFLAAWTCWEPDALDGKDSEFAGKTGHDATGRFIPLWYRGTNDVQLAQLERYTESGPGDYYLLARNSGVETVLEPRSIRLAGQETFVTAVAVPIRYNGEVVGVTGIYVAMDSLQQIVGGIRPYETGFACLLSASGRYVAHADRRRLGQEFGQNPGEPAVRQSIAAGRVCTRLQPFPQLGTELFEVFVPIAIGHSRTPWSLAVSLPLNRILAEADQAMFRSIGLGLLALAGITGIVVWFARSIARPLVRLAQDLDQTTGRVTQTSEQMQTSGQSLAEGASEQAASLEETSASLEEMASVTRHNAENAQQANALAQQARQAADAGATDMQAMSAAMGEIQRSSDDIAKIIRTIDEIAFQTNILALNAAVEAARAGEAGMGFAVVADEVRNLAQRSAQAARETADKIEGAIRKTAQGVHISDRVARSLQEIVGKTRQVDELVTQVATASREQSQGIEQVNTAVTQMDRVTQSNAANAEQSAHAAAALNAQALALRDAVTRLDRLVYGNRTAPPAAAATRPPDLTPIRPAGPGSGTTVPAARRGATPASRHRPQPAAPTLGPDHFEAPRTEPANAPAGDLITWDSSRMATGVESVDAQHQELIAMINQLHRACQDGTGKEELRKMMTFLADYVQTHFRHEESVMAEHRCPARGQNQLAHRKFLQSFGELVDEFEEKGASTVVLIRLKDLVGDWLTNHICSVDTGLRQCAGACAPKA